MRTRRCWCQWGMKRRPLRSQTKSVSSQPASPCPGRGDEPVSDEHKGAVGEGDAFGLPEVSVEDAPESQLIEQGPNDEDRPPVRGFAELGVRGITIALVRSRRSLGST